MSRTSSGDGTRRLTGVRWVVMLTAVLLAAPAEAVSADAQTVRNGRVVYRALNADGSSWDLYSVRPGGTGRRRLTFTGDSDEPTWSPDGRRIAYTRYGRGIWAMRADGTRKRLLIRNPKADGSPAWSPDGRKIAFTSARRPGSLQLYVHHLRTGKTRRLTSARGPWQHAYDPTWAPDGRRIAFTRYRTIDTTRFDLDVFTIRAGGSGLRRLTATPHPERTPAWSPDGRRILFERPGDGSSKRLLSMRPDGSGSRTITERICPGLSPAWSPDGRRIALSGAVSPGPLGLMTLSADGTHERQLTRDQGRSAAWQPLP